MTNKDRIRIPSRAFHNSSEVLYLKDLVNFALHEEEAYRAWNKALKVEPFDKIEPLYQEVIICIR